MKQRQRSLLTSCLQLGRRGRFEIRSQQLNGFSRRCSYHRMIGPSFEAICYGRHYLSGTVSSACTPMDRARSLCTTSFYPYGHGSTLRGAYYPVLDIDSHLRVFALPEQGGNNEPIVQLCVSRTAPTQLQPHRSTGSGTSQNRILFLGSSTNPGPKGPFCGFVLHVPVRHLNPHGADPSRWPA